MTYRKEICNFWHDCVQIQREALFGPHDEKCRPLHLIDDANTMFAGYAGRLYRTGAGILLLAINPGGGDAYRSRTAEDDQFYPLLKAFKNAPAKKAPEAFERVNETFAAMIQRWNLWRIVKPTLDAAGISLDEAAYMNLVPYRTRADKMPPVVARRAALAKIVEPSIARLAPKAVAALGKKAGTIRNIWEPNRPLYCVRRTIGDSYIHADALRTFAQMRRALD